MKDNSYYMGLAIKEAQKAYAADEVPVGAVLVCEGKVVARGYNQKEKKTDATQHAEMVVMQKASRKQKNWHLEDCTLYVTLEPCAMCSGAMIQTRIKKVVFGAYDPKGGSLRSCFNMYEIEGFNHYPEVEEGVREKECSQLLKDFFKNKRNT